MIFDSMRKDRIILLKKIEKTYQSVDSFFVGVNSETARRKKHTYKIPKEPSRINKWGKRTYYLEVQTGHQIRFDGSKIKTSFSADEMDMVLSQGIFRGFVNALKTQAVNNWVVIIMSGLMGLFGGIVVGLLIAGVI